MGIILVAIFLILHIFFKVDRTKAFCGIWGFTGFKDLTPLQMRLMLHKFHIVGLYNQSRGTDGCGVYIGGEIQKGVDKEKCYHDFIHKKSFELNVEAGHRTLIGHTRQASVGGKTAKDTHPFDCSHPKNKNKNIVGVMNGTIKNIWELCKEYNIDDKDITNDSKALYEIIVNKGYDVLSKYIGGAALLWTDVSNQNRIYAYHGESKATSYSKESVEERPLFFMRTPEGIWFSSLENSLLAISEESEWVEELKTNTVFEFVDGELVSEVAVDRKDFINEVYVAPRQSNYGFKNKFNTLPMGSVVEPLVWRETVPFINSEDKVIFCNGRFYVKNKLCEGELILTDRGYLNTKNKGAHYFFVRGVMMNNKKDYEIVLDSIKGSRNASLQWEKGYNFASAISHFSAHPTSNLPEEAKEMSTNFRLKWWAKGEEFSGSYTPKFSARTYTIKQGVLSKISCSESRDKSLFYADFTSAFKGKAVMFNNFDFKTILGYENWAKESDKVQNKILEGVFIEGVFYPAEEKDLADYCTFDCLYEDVVECIKDMTLVEIYALREYVEYKLGLRSNLTPDREEVESYIEQLVSIAVHGRLTLYESLSRKDEEELRSYLEMCKMHFENIGEDETKVYDFAKKFVTEDNEEIDEKQDNFNMAQEKTIRAISDLEDLMQDAIDLAAIDDVSAIAMHDCISKYSEVMYSEILQIAHKYGMQDVKERLKTSKLGI